MQEKTYANIAELLLSSGRISLKEKDNFETLFRLERICADGSLRNFIRVTRLDHPICIAVYPPVAMNNGLGEARSAVSIGRHLFSKGVPVPEVFGAEDSLGLVLFEDCGDVRLHDLFGQIDNQAIAPNDEITVFYLDVIETLAFMQIRGAEGFQPQWCYDTSRYDRDVMIRRESQYFLHSFWYDLLQGQPIAGIEEEFEDIAFHAGKGLNTCFLHRDFQSRNIMIADGMVRIIDFQAGRLGPPGYDLASLLIDPYSHLSDEFRQELLEKYLKSFRAYRDFDEKAFLQQYGYLLIQRNLQILGAFSFLLKNRHKSFFKNFIVPALQLLARNLSGTQMSPYVKLRRLVEQAGRGLDKVL